MSDRNAGLGGIWARRTERDCTVDRQIAAFKRIESRFCRVNRVDTTGDLIIANLKDPKSYQFAALALKWGSTKDSWRGKLINGTGPRTPSEH